MLPWKARREKVGKYHYDRDKRLCLGAGLLAAYALRQLGVHDLTLTEAENGKPELRNDSGLYFNISHSGSLAVCAVSERPVGVDVEQEKNPIVISDFRQCFQKEEMAWIYSCDNPIHGFFRLWTRKESYLKRLGTGLLSDPKSVSVLPGSLTENRGSFSEFHIMGHQICVALPEKEEVLFRKWEGMKTVLPGKGDDGKEKTMDIQYRIATAEDLDLLIQSRTETLRDVNHLAEDYVFSDEFLEASRTYFLEGNQETVLALCGDRVIGCATMCYINMMPTFSHPTGKRAHLMNVYTDASFRRNGIAHRMVSILIECAWRKGATEISLDATESGRPLYRKLGFKDSDECMTLEKQG